MIIRIHELLQSFPLGSYSLCVAFGVTLLLLSIVDIWKWEFRLAPFTLTAGVGALISAVIIKKYWVTQRTLSNIRKIESLHHSRLHPDKVQESTDPVSTFSLPQYIRVMVSNYQPLQTVFAIDKGECESREIMTDEQFSPIVTIVDTATQQMLDCVLLLHGEKPPEVNCRTLFCYIAVQVTVVPYYDDAHDSKQLLYHVKSKLCKQGKLPLFLCFYQPGTVCVIRLSIHSIADSEGVEYMYNSENCDCIVQIIDRNQHGRVNMTCRHGVVMVKEVPLLKYIGHLASAKYHKLEKHFLQLFLSPNY